MISCRNILYGHNRHQRHNDDCDRCDRSATCTWCSFMRDPEENRGENKSFSEGSLKFEWLNSEEAAKFLRISVKALRNMTSNGQLPYYKLGRRNRYRKDELETLLRSQKRGQYGN